MFINIFRVYNKLKIILSAGGTGGHIFPAIAIANYLKQVNPETEILFIGALGRMEMEKIISENIILLNKYIFTKILI